MEKEIHFYKDECFEYDAIKSHNQTMNAIKDGNTFIHTYAISALSFSYLLDLGYRIYLHENDKSFEIKLGNVVATDKEIRKAHDIRTIWIGGGFSDYFYGDFFNTYGYLKDVQKAADNFVETFENGLNVVLDDIKNCIKK